MRSPLLRHRIFVADVEMALVEENGGTRASAKVTVVDADGLAVAGANLTGTWSGVVSGCRSGATLADGTVTLTSKKTGQSGVYSFTVAGLWADGCTYDPQRNVETTDSIASGGGEDPFRF